MFRLPSPSIVVSVASLVIALGGAGYSATGGNFILGRANTASTPSTLTAHLNGKAFQLVNQVSAANASALGLVVAPGRPPMTVNSAAKVVNLNADRLDGLDSTHFARTKIIPFTLAPGATRAPIVLPLNRPVSLVGAVTSPFAQGVGEAQILRTFDNSSFAFLNFTATDAYSGISTPDVRGNQSNLAGTLIVDIDIQEEVKVEIHDATSIQVHNVSTATQSGVLRLIW